MANTLFDPDVYAGDGWRKCPRCESQGLDADYPDGFFRRLKGRSTQDLRWRAGKGSAPRARLCLGCEDELDEEKALRESLAQRIRTHAKRHGSPIKVYRERYNLGVDVVFAWWKSKMDSGVLDCGCLVEEMRHGTKDIELHQLNPLEPFFPDTWQLVCTNDHRGMGHVDHSAIKRGWQLWKGRRRRLPN